MSELKIYSTDKNGKSCVKVHKLAGNQKPVTLVLNEISPITGLPTGRSQTIEITGKCERSSRHLARAVGKIVFSLKKMLKIC